MNGKKLIIIRHAETQNSKDKLYQSWDSTILPVSPKLIEQIKKSLLSLGVEEIWASELDRSLQTADLFDLPTRKTHLLNEFLEPSSLPNKQISASSSYIFDAISKYDDNSNYTKEDGESLKELIDRILKFRAQVEKSDSELTVCVGHGFYMRLFALLTLVDREEITFKMLSSVLSMKIDKLNCTSLIFKDGKWLIETWNSKMTNFI